jgi:hypothetical protein
VKLNGGSNEILTYPNGISGLSPLVGNLISGFRLTRLLDQLQQLPEATMTRVSDLEDSGLYQAMLLTQNETPLSRAGA